MEEIIRKLIDKVLSDLNYKDVRYVLEHPADEKNGDWSSSVAMKLGKREGENPRELAEKIKNELVKDEELMKAVGRIEVAGPGFINFFLREEWLVEEVGEVIARGGKYGEGDAMKGKRIMVEYGQPNTHKKPHIGHLFSYIYGSSVIKLLENVGAKVYKANYQGDIGPHVAKCLWAYMREKPEVPGELSGKVEVLQEMYQVGSQEYEESEGAKQEIDELNKKIYEKDESVVELWEETRGWCVEYYKEFEVRIGAEYDRYYFESEVEGPGLKIVKDNVGKVFVESQGAIIFEGSKKGLHDRVFVTKRGIPTYEAKDMALQIIKMKEWPFDESYVTTASEQNEYFKVIYKALEELDPGFEGKLKHIGFGMVRLKTGKMSSRRGDIIGGIDLVDMTVLKIDEIVREREDLSDQERKGISEMVGVGAVRYALLKSDALQDTKFDLESSISREGNSGPYLQYTSVRCRSVLGKAKAGYDLSGTECKDLNKEELKVLRWLYRFPEVVEKAAREFSPHLVCGYLFELAQRYNGFYNKHRIIDEKDEKVRLLRLGMTSAVGQILENGLGLLGIGVPEKM